MAGVTRRVTFTGERGLPETGEVEIIGRTFKKGELVVVDAKTLKALRAHPQVADGQFVFEIHSMRT